MNKSSKLSGKHGCKSSKCNFQSGRDLEIDYKDFVSFASNKSQAPKVPKANIKAEWPKNSTGDSMLSYVNEKLMSCRSNIKMRSFGEVSVNECKIMPKNGTSDLIQKLSFRSLLTQSCLTADITIAMVKHPLLFVFCGAAILFVKFSSGIKPIEFPGTIYFSGLFAFHSSDGTDSQGCGEIDTQNAIIYYEAFRYAINYVNKLNLANYKIGYYAYDTCDSLRKLEKLIDDQYKKSYSARTVAIVGPSSSEEALDMSSVSNFVRINIISYAASSSIFDDRSRHTKLLRTIPSDSYQISAMIDIIRYFNWTYIVALSSCSNYEQKVLNTFDEELLSDRRCLARTTILPCVRTEERYADEMQNLLMNKKVRVVVLFTSKDDTIGLLRAAKKLKMEPGRLTWLGSTGWGNLNLKTYGLENIGLGALTLVYPSPEPPPDDFKKHFLSLNASNNNYTYFIEYWEAIFNCSLSGYPNKKNRSACSGNERLQDGIGWYPYTNVQPVFDAVLAAFRGFYRIMPDCPHYYYNYYHNQYSFYNYFCRWYAFYRSIKLVIELERTSYESMPSGRNMTFDLRGGFIGRYDILSYKLNASGNTYRRVGSWEAYNNVMTDGKLSVNDSLIHWPDGNKVQVSICSEPCTQSKGEIQISDTNEHLQYCCWTCFKCAFNQEIVNNTCVSCPELQIPNTARDSCVILPEETVRFFDSVGIAIISLSILGFLGTSFTVFLFAYFYSSSIVKATGRELSFIMIVGIYLCFVAAFVFLSRPCVTSCGMQRFIAGFSFSVIYAPLFLKTNRIFRIFQSAKITTARPSLTRPFSQVIISLGIVLVQGVLGVTWIIVDPPTVQRSFPTTNDKYKLFCKADPYTMVLNLLICLAIMIACTYYAFRTRNFPRNYNETKSIMYTLYFSCFAWGIFLPTYLLSNDIESFLRTYTVAVFCNAIGIISLIGLFGPKIRLILCNPRVTDCSSAGTIISVLQDGSNRTNESTDVFTEEKTGGHFKKPSDIQNDKGAAYDVPTHSSAMPNNKGDEK